MGNFTIPNRPAGSDIRDIGAIEADFDAVTGYIDSVTNARRLIAQAEAFIPAGQAAAYNFIASDGTLVGSAANSQKSIKALYLDSTNYAISGKTTNIRLRASIAVNGISSGSAGLNVGLHAVTWSGNSGNIVPTLGALQVATGLTNPIVTGAAELSVAFPASGFYAITTGPSSVALPAGCAVTVLAQLFVEWS